MKRETEELTGLPNRDVLEQALRRSVEAANGVALALLDIDHFLEVYHGHGQEAGDRLLQNLAALLEEETPGCAYRISGDEFAVLMPDLGLEQAFLRMEALRAKIESAADRFDLPDGRAVTVGIGVAQYPRDAKDVEGLLQAASAAMASAKENGSNQVGLPPNEEMIMKSCYYPASALRKLKALAERLNRKESVLLREALNDLLRKHDTP